MTDQNNAAQPGLTDDEIEALAKKHIAPHADRLEAIMTNPVPYQQTEQFRRVKALIGDLLSKLRAEGVQAGDERESFSDWAWRKDGLAIGHMDGQAAAWEAWQERARRAALASAPVADTLPLEKALYELVDKIAPGLDTGDLVQDARRASTLLGVIMASAPVAGEAQHPDDIAVDNFAAAMKAKLAKKRAEGRYGWQSTSHITLSALLYEHMYKGDPLDVGNLSMMLHQNGKPIELPEHARRKAAAPQASEAVRILFPTYLRKMWSGGEVQAWLDEYQGLPSVQPSAKGSLERYRQWQAEQAQADKDGGDCAKGAGDERAEFEAWAVGILGDNPTWRESAPCELAWQAWTESRAAQHPRTDGGGRGS